MDQSNAGIGKTVRRWLVGCAAALVMTTAAAAQPAAKPTAADLLARANAAFAADRMVAPAGDNALEWTLAAGAIDPDSARVREGINDLYPLVVAAIERDIRSDREAEALRVIALLERAMPNSLAARQLRAKLDRRNGSSTAPVTAQVGVVQTAG